MSGPIPAWAGEPKDGRRLRLLGWAYPRVGGGTSRNRVQRGWLEGLSPRGRGNQGAADVRRNIVGPIPAWAGEPGPGAANARPWRAYPRVGGGTYQHQARVDREAGLSPRGRGNPAEVVAQHVQAGPIPAWAGEPWKGWPRAFPRWAYPRVGGGTVTTASGGRHLLGLSPRGRGNHPIHPATQAHKGPIPAWAGEPTGGCPAHAHAGAYPRVGGGTFDDASKGIDSQGLSPRGRGNLHSRVRELASKRPIPAWAGEPEYGLTHRKYGRAYPRVGGGTAVS